MKNNWFYHEHNIDTKISNNYKGLKSELIRFKDAYYSRFKDKLMGMTKNDINSLKLKVDLLNEYYKRIEEFESKYSVTSQSKFRSTILEEFNGYLFKDIPEMNKLGLDFYNKKIFAGLNINTEGKIGIITKDVDFCIGKQFSLKSDTEDLELIIPITATEVKTYLDATMFNEVQFSMQIIKNATPNVKTYILIERNEVSRQKILGSKSDSPLDEIFVIRGNVENDIDFETVYEYYSEVYEAINTNLDSELKVPGRLFK